MRPILILFALGLLLSNASAQTRILFITTNVDQMGEAPNGTFYMELAIPFHIFDSLGYAIDIVSPKGGPIPLYHKGDTTSRQKVLFHASKLLAATRNSISAKGLNPDAYQAVIIPGGYGQFWDIHTHRKLLDAIAHIYESGGIIGSVGHGTSTLAKVNLSTGKPLVEGASMVCFPSLIERKYMEESDFGHLLPFDMEEELQNRGAKLHVYRSDPPTNFLLSDEVHRIVTASFASDGDFVAEEVARWLEKQSN